MKICFLTNILTPYRCYFFDLIQSEMVKRNNDFKVFVMTESLPLRPWSYDTLKREYTVLLPCIKKMLGDIDYLYNFNVNKELLSFAPDILILAGSWTYPTIWKVLLSKKIHKKCKVLFWTESHTHNGLDSSTKTSGFISNLKKYIMNSCDGFCVPGKYALETVSTYVDVNKKEIIRLPNLVDNQYFYQANLMRENRKALREKNNVLEETFVFYTPARLVDLKGQLSFFTKVGDAVNNRDVLFALAGMGPDQKAIYKIADEKKLNIRLLGYQNQENIREWLALSDAFLLPSLSDPNPLSNIEAAWSGLPLCISCYVGNGPELVKDGENGVIYDTLDRSSVTEKISYVLTSGKPWCMIAGKISLEKAQSGFDGVNETQRFVEELNNYIEKSLE